MAGEREKEKEERGKRFLLRFIERKKRKPKRKREGRQRGGREKDAGYFIRNYGVGREREGGRSKLAHQL